MQFTDLQRPRRRPSLTPMIDVVFLLLVFFMLASRFGFDTAITLPLAGGGGAYSGPPRLIDIGPETLSVNGVETADLIGALSPLMASSSDTVILRGGEGANLQRVIDVSEQLQQAGLTNLVLIE